MSSNINTAISGLVSQTRKNRQTRKDNTINVLDAERDLEKAARNLLLQVLQGKQTDPEVARAARATLKWDGQGMHRTSDLPGHPLTRAATDVLTRAFNGEKFAPEIVHTAQFVMENIDSEADQGIRFAYTRSAYTRARLFGLRGLNRKSDVFYEKRKPTAR